MKYATNAQLFSNELNRPDFSLMICVGGFKSDATHELRDFLGEIPSLGMKKTQLNIGALSSLKQKLINNVTTEPWLWLAATGTLVILLTATIVPKSLF